MVCFVLIVFNTLFVHIYTCVQTMCKCLYTFNRSCVNCFHCFHCSHRSHWDSEHTVPFTETPRLSTVTHPAPRLSEDTGTCTETQGAHLHWDSEHRLAHSPRFREHNCTETQNTDWPMHRYSATETQRILSHAPRLREHTCIETQNRRQIGPCTEIQSTLALRLGTEHRLAHAPRLRALLHWDSEQNTDWPMRRAIAAAASATAVLLLLLLLMMMPTAMVMVTMMGLLV